VIATRSALRIPALPDGWKASFRAMTDQADALGGAAGTTGLAAGNAGLTAVSQPPAWPGFRPLTVTAVDRESDSVVSVHLDDPGGTALPSPQPGQFLTLRLDAVPGDRPLLRSYSLSGPPDASAALVDLGVDGARVHTEIFGAAPAQTPGIAAAATRPPHPPAGEPAAGPEVAFARSGLTVRWDRGYGSLLELADRCGRVRDSMSA